MKPLYSQNLLKLAVAITLATGVSKGYAQALTVDVSAPRNIVINNNGNPLDTDTYNYVRVPELLSIDTISPTRNFYRSLRMSWAVYVDAANPPVPPKLKTGYADDGVSWTVSANVARFGSAIKLKSGKILSLEFKPTYPGPYSWPLVYYTSTNNGASYITHTDGMVTFTKPVLGLRMQKNILEEPDGTLYTCAYVRYNTDASFRTCLLKSTDGGVNWVPMLSGTNTIYIAPDNTADEGTITRCADGSWLCVMKQITSDPDVTLPLIYSKSTDKGLTWSPVATLPGAGSAASGKNPCVILMPNGVLALTFGTPDVKICFSSNNGGTWTTPIATYPDPGGSKRPSGNTWVTNIGPNTVLQHGDNYAKTINPNTQAIWQKEVEVVRPEQNRIDLMGKLNAGTLNIVSGVTTLTDHFPGHAVARDTAAFDGSVNYWASAIKSTGGSGDIELDLHSVYHIKGIGVALLYGVPESADISLSPDGTTWTSVKSYPSGTTHYCLNYTSFASFDARYVKVHVAGSGTVGLSELELYQTASSFENNAAEASGDTNWPHGILPTGYAPAGTSSTQYGVSVAKGNVGYQSDRALKLYDGSDSWIAGVKKIVTSGNTKTLEFRVRPAAIPVGGSFNWRIMGTVSGAESTVFFFAVFAETSGSTTTYKLKSNNGTGWTQIGTATIPVSGSVWKKVRVEANESANQAKVYLDDVLQGTVGMYSNTTNTTTLTGFEFNSNGTATSGELIYFDDVDFYDTSVGPTQFDAVNPDKLLPTVITNDVNTPKVFGVSVSPNPSNGAIAIHIANGTKGATTIFISNMAGKVVKKLNYTADAENSGISASVQGYMPGVYVITAQQNGQSAQTKLSVY